MSELSINSYWLKDTYASVNFLPIFSMKGPKTEDILNDELLFVNGNYLTKYIDNNFSENMDDYIITIVINLTNFYWTHKAQLSESEIPNLKYHLMQAPPEFQVVDTNQHNSMMFYRLQGDIHPYNVLHIPVKNFLDSVDSQSILEFQLEGISTLIQLYY